MKPIHIYAFADEADPQIDGQIAAMKENGVEGLEIRTVDGKNVVDITAEKAKEVRRKLDAAGLRTWSIGSPIGKIDIEAGDFAAHKEQFCRVLETADILGAENIRLFSFYLPKECRPADYENEVIDRLGQLLTIAKGSGVALCHENEKGIFGDTAPRCATLLKALPELYGIFDPANFIQCGQETLAGWELLKSRIRYLHIKDALPDGNVVPAGKGAGHVGEIVADYIARGGQNVTIEPHLAVFSALSGLERAGEKSQVGAYVYDSNGAAFAAAVAAFRALV